MARKTAELVFPVGSALLPFGLVVGDTLPSWVIDATFVVLTIFSATLVATYARLPVGAVLLACSGVAIVAITQRPNLFALTLIPLAAFVLRETDIRVITRRFTIVSLLLFAGVVGLYLSADFNAANDMDMWRSYSGEFVHRLSVGFSHPNRAMMEWAVVSIALLAFASPRARARWALPVAIATAALYLGTDSRTSAVLTTVFLLAAVVFRRRFDSPVAGWVRGWVVAAPVLAVAASLMLASLASVPEANRLLSGRPRLYADLLREHSLFELFGNPAVENAIVDNGFIHLALSKGLVLATLYIATLTALLARPSYLSWRTALIAVVFLSMALVETTLLEFAFLILLLASLEIDRRSGDEFAPSRGSRE